MKTWAKLVLATAAVGTGMTVYVWRQPKPVATTGSGESLTPSTQLIDTAARAMNLGPGQRPWANQYDDEGRLQYRFRAAEYEPQEGGTVRVIAPSFEFFLSDGQVVRLRGRDGVVYLPPNAAAQNPLSNRRSGSGGGGGAGGGGGVPTRGTLKDVAIDLYESPEAAAAGTEDGKVLTATMDNVGFDNDTYRIATESYTLKDPTGTSRTIAADKVPVVVRGRDYDFDGEGLSIVINERDRTIQRLDIARGTRLVVRNTDAMDFSTERGEGTGDRGQGSGERGLGTQGLGSLSTPERFDPDLAPGLPLPGAYAQSTPVAPQTSTVIGEASPVVPQASTVVAQAGPVAPEASTDFVQVRSSGPQAGTVVAQAGPSAPPSGAGGSGVEARRRGDVVYRATIRGGVKVVQGAETSGTGDTLQIDFRPGLARAATSAPAGSPATGAVPQGGGAPAGSGPGPVGSAASPADAGRTNTGGVPTKAPAGTRTARRPGEPVVLTWDGPVQVLGGAGDALTPPGKAIVTLSGTPQAPAVLKQGTSLAKAPAVMFETGPRIATLQGTDALPVTLSDDRGSVVTTALLKYDLTTREARLLGPTVARAVADRDEAGNPRMMLATWAREGLIRFARGGDNGGVGGGGGGGRVESAVLAGDVKVDHPQLQLRAGKLDLAFGRTAPNGKREPGDVIAGGADLRKVVATGDVEAVILEGADKGTRPGLRGDSLTLTTARDAATGKLYADRVHATGNVRGTDGKQALSADDLAMDLAPAAGTTAGMGASRVQTLLAKGNVRAESEDGSVATAGVMTVRDASGKPDVTLEGTASTPASVAGKDATLFAPLIRYDQGTGRADVPGAGRLVGVQKAGKPGEKDTPFTITWSGGAKLNSQASRVDVSDTVVFEAVGADGAVSTARARELTLFLTDAPTTGASSSAPVGGVGTASRGAAPGPGASGSGSVAPGSAGNSPGAGTSGRGAGTPAFMGAKTLKSVELRGKVELENLLGDAAGGLARQFTLLTEKVVYEGTQAFAVPGPGRLLLVDKRAAQTARANTPADAFGSGRGTTAMMWKDSLRYDPAARALAFVGNVVFVHQPLEQQLGPDGKPEQPLRLDADRMTAYLREGDTPGVAGGVASGNLRSVSAEGNLYFVGRGVGVRAARMDFDPEAQLLTARGEGRIPVTVDDSRGAGSGTADSVRYNLKTGLIEDLTNPTGNMGGTGAALPGQRPRGNGGK